MTFPERPLSILVVIFQFHPVIGGAERQAEAIAHYLLRGGCRVKVLTARLQKGWPAIERLTNQKQGGALEIVRLPWLPVHRLGALFYLAALFFYLVRHARQYDVIQVYMAHYSAAACAVVGRLLNKPVVCKISGTGETGDMEVTTHAPFSPILLSLLRQLDRVVAVSQQARSELLQAGFAPDRIVDIPNGVDVLRFTPATSPDAKAGSHKTIVTYVGRLHFNKGIDTLIKAVSQWGGENYCIQLVGTGPFEGDLRQLAEAYNMTNRVKFLGQVDDVATVLRSSDIFALPSRFEGLSNALLEAMACGLPVVASRVSGNVDVIQDGFNGLLVQPDSVKELAAAIDRLARDKALSARLGVEARRTVEARYSLEAVTDRYLALYREVIEQRNHAKKTRTGRHSGLP